MLSAGTAANLPKSGGQAEEKVEATNTPSDDSILSKVVKKFAEKQSYKDKGLNIPFYESVFQTLKKTVTSGEETVVKPRKFLTEKGAIATSGKRLLVARVCKGMYDLLYKDQYPRAGGPPSPPDVDATAALAAQTQADFLHETLRDELERINSNIDKRLDTLQSNKGITIKRTQGRLTYVSVAKSLMDAKLLKYNATNAPSTLTVDGLTLKKVGDDYQIKTDKDSAEDIDFKLALALFLEASEDEKIHGYMTSKFKVLVQTAEAEFGKMAREMIRDNSIKKIVENLSPDSVQYKEIASAQQAMKSSRKHLRQFVFACQIVLEDARSKDNGTQSLVDYVNALDLNDINAWAASSQVPAEFVFTPESGDADLLAKIKTFVVSVEGSTQDGTSYLKVVNFFASLRAHLLGKMSKHGAVSVGVHIKKLIEVRQAFRQVTSYKGKGSSTELQQQVTFIPVKRRNQLMQRYFPTKYAKGFVEYRSVGVGIILKILQFFESQHTDGQSETRSALSTIFKEDNMTLEKAAELIPLMSRDTLLSRIRKFAKTSGDAAIQAFTTFKMDYRAPNLSYTRNFSSQMDSYEAAIKGSVPPASATSSALKDFLTVSMNGKGVPSISRQMVDSLQGLIAAFVVEAVRRANALAAQKSGTRRRSVGKGDDQRAITVQKQLDARDVSMALMTMMGSNTVSFEVSMTELELYVKKQKEKLEAKKAAAEPAKKEAYEKKKREVAALWQQYKEDYKNNKSRPAPVNKASTFVKNVADFKNTMKAFRQIRTKLRGGDCIHEMNISRPDSEKDGLFQLQEFMSEMSDAELLAQLHTEKYMSQVKSQTGALLAALGFQGQSIDGTEPYEILNELMKKLYVSGEEIKYEPKEWPWVDYNLPSKGEGKRKLGTVQSEVPKGLLKGRSKISFTGKYFSVPLIKRIAQTTTSTKLGTCGAFCISMGINAMLKLLSNNIAKHYEYNSVMGSMGEASQYAKQVKTQKHEMLYPKHVYYGLLKTNNHDLYALLKMLHPQFLTSTQDLTYLDEVQDDY